MRSARLFTLAALASLCGSASAHSPIPGMGRFYSGMLHPLLVPAHLMAVIAMGLWLGQRGPATGRPMLALLLAVPVGMAAGFMSGWPGAELAILCLAVVVAVAVAAARDVPPIWRAVVGAMLGAMLGSDSLPDGLQGRSLWLSLAGTWLAFLLGLSCMVTVSEFATRPWMKIGLRVVASWLAAAALLVLALSWLGPRSKPPAAAAAASATAPR